MDWKDTLATVAPWAAKAVGGPLGALAVEALSAAFGLTEKTETALKAAVAGATPEQMIAAAQADREFALKMQQLGFDHAEKIAALEVQDRGNARDREVKTGDHFTPRAIAFVVIIGFFGILLVMMFHGIPQEAKEPALIMLGSLGAAFTGCVAYYFGSTSGSLAKSQMLAQSTPANADVQRKQ